MGLCQQDVFVYILVLDEFVRFLLSFCADFLSRLFNENLLDSRYFICTYF